MAEIGGGVLGRCRSQIMGFCVCGGVLDGCKIFLIPPSISLSLSLSLFLSLPLSLTVSLSVPLSVCLSDPFCLCICLTMFSMCSLSLLLSVALSNCPPPIWGVRGTLGTTVLDKTRELAFMESQHWRTQLSWQIGTII